MLIFSAAVFESFVYLIGNGALEWGPVRRLRTGDAMSANRTASSTIRRVGVREVGLEGRRVGGSRGEAA